MKIMRFESWQDSEQLQNTDNKTGVFSSENDHDLACSGCGNIHLAPKTVQQFLCDKCEELGWWVDPSGGIHAPDSDDDFDDPAAMYEKLYEEFYDEQEIDLDPPFEMPKFPSGIGKFENIDWETLHETLKMNTEILKDKTSNEIAYNVGDLTDQDGMLSHDELKLLEEGDLIYVWDGFPIIDEDGYMDYQTFYNDAKKLWQKILIESWSDNNTLVDVDSKLGIFSNKDEMITTVDDLFNWYQGDDWTTDWQTANSLTVNGEHAQDDGADGMTHINKLAKFKNSKIAVKVVELEDEEYGVPYGIEFELNKDKYYLDSINRPFENE